jgi:putative flippase GtrA
MADCYGQILTSEMKILPPNRLFKEFRRFLVVGGINTAVGYGVYQLGLFLMPYWGAYSLSFGFGILFSWKVNSHYSFGIEADLSRLLPYATVAIGHYLIGVMILAWLVERVGVNEMIAPLIVIASLVPLSFVATRFALSWRRR